MTRFFNKKNPDPIKTEISDFNSAYKRRFKSESWDQAENSAKCCASLSGCFSSVSSKIPPEYQDITTWLSLLAGYELSDGFNEVIVRKEVEDPKGLEGKNINLSLPALSAALKAALDFANNDRQNHPVAANALISLIDEITKKFNIDLNNGVDYQALKDYCQQFDLTIPEPIQNIINQNSLSNVA